MIYIFIVNTVRYTLGLVALCFALVVSVVSCNLYTHIFQKTFSALLALCEENSHVTDGFPSQMPVTRSFDVFFDLRLNKRLSKQSRCG